jgi:hypothetical protein
MVLFVVLGFLVLLGVNQAVAIVITLASGYFLQKTVDENKKGYMMHLFCRLGLMSHFPYGKFRI